MKKLIYLFILAIGFTSCSVESIDSTENLLTADMKIKIQQVDKSMTLKAEEICEGDAPVFVFNFPQNMNGPHNANTSIKIQIETFPGSDEWVKFEDLSYSGAGPVEYTYEGEKLEIGTYNFRAMIVSGGHIYTTTLYVFKCVCDESFSYVENDNGSYTFTYVPAEDVDGAEVVFTFAQGVAVSGLDSPWSTDGQTKQNTLDLKACTVYTWTVELTPDCNGNSNNSNVWTYFNVGDYSKKNDETPNIKKSC